MYFNCAHEKKSVQRKEETFFSLYFLVEIESTHTQYALLVQQKDIYSRSFEFNNDLLHTVFVLFVSVHVYLICVYTHMPRDTCECVCGFFFKNVDVNDNL